MKIRLIRLKKTIPALLALLFLVAIPFFDLQTVVLAASQAQVDEIRRNIADRNAKIEQLNKEIKELDTQIQAVAKEGQSLKSVINTLDASKSKLIKEIEATQTKVGATTLSISELEREIAAKENQIKNSRLALGEAIRDMNIAEGTSLVETIFAYEKATDLWDEIETLSRFQASLKDNIQYVEELKGQLAAKKSENEAKKESLIGFKSELEDQKKIVDDNKSQKAKLLSETQNREEEYRKQLEEKKRLGEAFARELNEFESQLKFIIDPTSYPSPTKGILAWPIDNVFITQYFGDTEFSRTTNAYNGKGHNGIDLRATTGTKVMSALSGTVEGVGNSDIIPGCFSYGKWVLVRHDNGLSTLYAHLSLIKVTQGQRVATGEIIGYSGYTGYVLPPGPQGAHLHFGLYVSQGVKVIRYESNTNCNGAIIPVADPRALLNPFVYL